jgi:hypothetical protein
MSKRKLLPIILLALFMLTCQRSPKVKFEVRKEKDDNYVAVVPKGQWYDTGVSVGPNKQIFTVTTPDSAAEPFLVRIGNLHETQAGVTNNACCGLTTTTPDTMKNEQLYLRVPDSTNADFLLVRINLGEPKGP